MTYRLRQPRGGRRAGAVHAVHAVVAPIASVVGVLALSACSQQGGLSPAVLEQGQSTPVTLAQEQADGVVDGVLHTIADDLGAEFDSAGRTYVACSGADATPGGVVVRTVVTLSTDAAAGAGAGEQVRGALDEDGWDVPGGASSAKVVATKDDQTLSVASEGGSVSATLDSACITTSTNEALALQQRATEPVAWR
ncbi:hypothetical protein [Nocardioides sp.]|uniref:hypothetical protein n=1 Tax=Nocardioides sp. TaxID=35761 RepID=UPI00351490FE